MLMPVMGLRTKATISWQHIYKIMHPRRQGEGERGLQTPRRVNSTRRSVLRSN